jgi:hypothetical protein
MQIVEWTGQGEGTIESPFLLNVDSNFDIEAPFNILLSNNYIDIQREVNYFRFTNSITKYILAYIISNRDSLLYFETKHAIKVTAFLTDKVDYIDGPFVVSSYGGIQYVVKQQIFDPARSQSEGYYRGLWVSGESYSVNDTVVYNGFLYRCITSNFDVSFTASKWENLSGSKTIIQTRDPLASDYNYDIGTLWINTVQLTHFILVKNLNNIAIWNLGSIKADEETLSVNETSRLEIKNKTVEGGEW